MGHLPTWGVHLSVSYPFGFSYWLWGSQGKNTEVVCHSLLQWATFCQNSPSWLVRLRRPYMGGVAHSFIELDKAVLHVIRLVSFLWVWFQCVCPLMPSCNTYHLTWVSLTLGMGFLLPWTWGISSQLLQQSTASAPYPLKKTWWGWASRGARNFSKNCLPLSWSPVEALNIRIRGGNLDKHHFSDLHFCPPYLHLAKAFSLVLQKKENIAWQIKWGLSRFTLLPKL